MAANAEKPLTRAEGAAQQLSIANTPFLASAHISDKAKLFPIPPWAPRSGRNMQFRKWEIGIARLGKAFGLPDTWIHDKPLHRTLTNFVALP